MIEFFEIGIFFESFKIKKRKLIFHTPKGTRKWVYKAVSI